MTTPRVIEVTDERTPLAERALELIQNAIWDVHPARYLLAELRETRQGTAQGGGYHLLAAVEAGATPIAAATGVYLATVNAGFVSYLAVREDHRGRGLGKALRGHLVEAFRGQARREAGTELSYVVGEVERESPWLRSLIAEGRTIALDVPYFHPWMSLHAEGHYALYREEVTDTRAELPSEEVARIIKAIWRRAYHFQKPEQRDTFRRMMRALEGRATVGPAPDLAPPPRGTGHARRAAAK
jgi:GNAT superfamily N-acetyltransferase